ncbi:MAG TPA: hypothetical protein PLB00_08025 [Pseudomonadota bacterium]|jgi:tRNA (mo5U34)-methyltransferase|nr:hypothetical protein [Pseudomonadota bacterium]
METRLDIGTLSRDAIKFMRHHDARKREMAVDFPWYPWPSLTNFQHLDRLLRGENRDLRRLLGEGTAVDIGAADGDVAFFMESLGVPMHVVDYPPTNYNSCRGVRAMRDALSSKVDILETDLDDQFRLPQSRYEFAFFLGILYHLKNPFFVLEALAKSARHAVISTRIASHNLPSGRKSGDGGLNAGRVELASVPAAYLVAPDECNNDATNYWIFSEAGLKRILHRTGWDVLDFMTVGAVGKSDPATPDGDERAFCLVKSRHF